jgi:hypothetical protein
MPGASARVDVPYRWRRCDACGAQGKACGGTGRGVDNEALAVLLHLCLAQGAEIAATTKRDNAILQLLLEHQG